MSNHLKRHFAPKSWKIKRKGISFITKPSAGTHKIYRSLPVNVILRDLLGYVKNNREAKFVLGKKNVTIDGIRRKDFKFPIGIFDVLSLNDIKEHFRIILDKRGRLDLIKIGKEESKLKLCRIIGKRYIKGKVQLNLYDGKNILVSGNEYKVGDVILLSLGSKFEVKEKIKFEKGILIYLIGGKHIGQIGKIQDIIGNRVLYKTEDGIVVETLKKDAFPVGTSKPLISLTG